MGGVFISYRNTDSQGYGALIYHELYRRFGVERVFLDSESILAGEDFAEVLLHRMRKCSVLLVVIGRRWLTITDDTGRRRIDLPQDWVRRELVAAFTYGLRVVPVLIDGVEIPAEADLPADIAALSRCQSLRMHHRNASHDLARLVKELTDLDPELAEAAARCGDVPHQLLAAPRLFTGRARELDRLTAALVPDAGPGATVVISAIGGTGGIGKTALALHWAHQNIERFPDGQLYVNLRGFDPSGSPMSPEVAIRIFLDALGAQSGAIPVDLAAQSALYRSLLTGKRMLIVLDNARNSEQVVPLLPGEPMCTVLVTSRYQLAGLATGHGALLLDLDALSDAEARELLAGHLGHDRLNAEPDAVAELLDRCAGLPLALGIVATRAATHPGFPLAVLAEELRAASTRLDALHGGELSVDLRSVFACSHRALSTGAAEIFGLLGLVPGPDISLAAVASLAALPTTRTRALLRELEAAYLVHQHTPDRYRMHDLTRLYAAERARYDHSPDTRDVALRRLVDFYLHTAHDGDRLLHPHRQPIALPPVATGCVPHPLGDAAAALSWFDTEHSCLLSAHASAVQHGWNSAAWKLGWSLNTFHHRRAHLRDNIALWQVVLTTARQSDELAVQIMAHRRLGYSYSKAGEHTVAVEHLEQGLALAEQIDDIAGQAYTHHALTWTWSAQREEEKALIHAAHALSLYRLVDDPIWKADLHTAMAWSCIRLERYDQAREHCEEALAQFRRHQFPQGEATALESLGYLAHHTGRYTEALNYYRQALVLSRDLGNSYHEADTLAKFGETYDALGRQNDARDAWQQALALYQAQHRTIDAERIQHQLVASMSTPPG